MDYYKKYIKYKNKYLKLQNNLSGSNLELDQINKFYIYDIHGSLLLDESFTVPDNLYIIQMNICGLSNFLNEKIFTNDDNTLKNFDELLKYFESSSEYIIIKPKTTICDISLSESYDNTIYGLINILPGKDIFYSIIFNLDNNKICNKMENYFKIEESKYIRINIQFKDFDFNKYIYLIKYIIDSQQYFKFDYFYKFTEYIKGINIDHATKITNLNFESIIKNIYKYFVKDKDISKKILEIPNNSENCEELIRDLIKYIEEDNKTYLRLLFNIFITVFILDSIQSNYDIKLSEVNKQLLDNKTKKNNILFITSCLNIPEKYDSDNMKKIERCQAKLANIQDDSDIFINIDGYNIYNFLLNNIDNIYTHINSIITITQSIEDEEFYFIWLILDKILFNKDTIFEKVHEIIHDIDKINKQIYFLIYILCSSSDNLTVKLRENFENYFDTFQDYEFNKDETLITDILGEEQISKLYKYKYYFIYILNYYYINTILNQDKIRGVNIETIFIKTVKDNFIITSINKDYLIDKIKDKLGDSNLNLSLVNINFNDDKIIETYLYNDTTQKDKVKSKDDKLSKPPINIIYLNSDKYYEIISKLFSIYLIL